MNAAEKKKYREKKRCVTPEGRLSFPAIFKARTYKGKTRFGATLLFDKNEDLTPLKKARRAAIEEKWGKDKDKWPKFKHKTFKDGNEKKDLEGYKDTIYVTAYAINPPGVVDADGETELTEADGKALAGDFVRAELNAFTYEDGVAFGLENIQYIKKGKRFSGRKDPKDVFDAVEDTESDEDDSSGDGDDDDDAGF